MIDHILLLTLKDDAASTDVEALVTALQRVSEEVNGVLWYRVERDARLRDGNDDLAVVARFRDEEAFRAYLTHHLHLAVVAELAPRVLAGKHAIQFRTSEEDA
jgi:quinol monooxygenase YgiN